MCSLFESRDNYSYLTFIYLKIMLMKKVLLRGLSVIMAVIVLVAQTQSLTAKTVQINLPSVDESVFNLDEDALNNAMQELNELENYLALNEGTSYDDLLTSGSELIANVSDSSSPMGMAQEGEAPLGIPAFLWGCVLGWVGLLVVYLVTDNDKAQVKKALTGCIVSTLTTAAIYVVYIVWLVDETDLYYY